MEIRPTVPEDIPEIVKIYDKARAFMRRSGNLHQWSDNYPNEESLLRDIAQGCSYVCVDEGLIVGTFFFMIGKDPTYTVIEGGEWLNDGRYGVIHRVASDGSVKGLMHKILDFCAPQIDNIRIDTHRDNTVMQNALLSYGFKYCGIIHIANGDERLAYQYPCRPQTKPTSLCRRLKLLLSAVAIALTVVAQDVEKPDAAEPYTLYELKTDTLPSMHIARSGHGALCIDGELSVFGGHTDGFIPTATAEYFRDGAWHTVPLVYPHDNGTVLGLRSGKVFLAGGHKEALGIGLLYSAQLYDPQSHSAQGFGCMDMKRAFASALEVADGQVVIAGNWCADDGIEMFGDVADMSKPNAIKIKEPTSSRSRPYILQIADDNAIIFGSLNDTNDPSSLGTVDRLKGPSYHEPLLATWLSICPIAPQQPDNQFIGNAAEGRYEWLLPVVNPTTGRTAIARVMGRDDDDSAPTFSLITTRQPVPDSINGRPIGYGSLVCDHAREIAYLIGNDDEARIIVVAISYRDDVPGLAIYVTEPQPVIARSCSPVLTPDGDLVLAGGHLLSNFSPSNSVIRLPLGDVNKAEATVTGSNSRSWWLGLIVGLLLGAGVAAYMLWHKRLRSLQTPTDADTSLDKNLPKDEILAELFNRIERLMDQQRLYLNPNLKASDVAAQVGSNTAYVSAAINSQNGCSFTKFLTNYRIAHAQQLMRQNPASKISSISAQSGFSTDSTFFRAFRSSTGKSPKEWLSTISDER